jgi:hypothetical protein
MLTDSGRIADANSTRIDTGLGEFKDEIPVAISVCRQPL